MNLSRLLNASFETDQFAGLINKLNLPRVEETVNIYEPSISFALAVLWRAVNVPILVITPNAESSRRIYDQLHTWLEPRSPIYQFSEVDEIPFERYAPDSIATHARLKTVASFRQRFGKAKYPLVVSSIQAASQSTLERTVFDEVTTTFVTGDQVDMSALTKSLVRMGYRTESTVEVPGTFSQRGGILDVYTVTERRPVRIEFFGDHIDSMRLFHPETQRSFKRIRSFIISPSEEILPVLINPDKVNDKLSLIEIQEFNEEHRIISSELGRALAGEISNHISFYAGFFNFGSIFDYLTSDSITILIRPDEIESAALSIDKRYEELRSVKQKRGSIPINFPQGHLEWPYISDAIEARPRKLSISPWVSDINLSDSSMNLPFETLSLKYLGHEKVLENVKSEISDNKKVIAVSAYSRRLVEMISKDSEENEQILDMSDQSVSQIPFPVIEGYIPNGFQINLKDIKILVLSDTELFGVSKERRVVKSRPIRKGISLEKLRIGSFVVHVEHGIAIFSGTEILDDGREFLVLIYADDDKLFVPTEHLDRVQLYHGSADRAPKLTRLGTQEWNKARARAKRATEQIAGELLALYTTRSNVEGYTFASDTPWQGSLESSFPYYETEDQLSTLSAVKEDMESSTPMDRLVCGDVGFGKTEIALRSAFKAVQSGKQVAVLVPTTVLAQQHYETFMDRLKVFPISVGILSRFKTVSEQRKVIDLCKRGGVDIVIGTHRLLQKDVKFRDIGLLIIDEEHKFGVDHKERMKQIKTNIDVLTLSATPIPRTLNMSLAGIRDLSTIETPPEERLPIKTYVSEMNESLVREAILREYDRGGQVYFLHNRVKDIDSVLHKLSDLLPETKINIAHGQMKDDDLEEMMAAFERKEFDVLVCTTIIESGIDLPNVNTLIVNRADKFGLSQLYQLRGRIGRGSNRAYAYFLVPKSVQISEAAEKRLNTILSATELGSGFRIALRDLEIRGIGNILGTEQSGQISAVGFELYSTLLAQAVEQARSDENVVQESPPVIQPEFSTVRVDIGIDARIPDAYINDLPLRLHIYQRLASVNTLEDVELIIQETKDRFGPIPKNVELLRFVTRIRILAENAGIERISSNDDLVTIMLAEPTGGAKQALSNILGENVTVGNQQIRIGINREDLRWIEHLSDTIERIQSFRDGMIEAMKKTMSQVTR